MTQRTRTRETTDDFSDLLDDADSAETSGSSQSYSSRVKQRAGELFSVRFFVLAVVSLTVARVGGGIVPVIGGLTGLVAMFAVSFVLGALTSDSRIVETALGGAVAGGVVFALSHLIALSLGGFTVAAIGLVAGFLVAGLGAYFGGDLRDGFTREL